MLISAREFIEQSRFSAVLVSRERKP